MTDFPGACSRFDRGNNGSFDLCNNRVDKTWREGKDDLGYPYLRLIAKSDIGQRDPATV